MSGVGGAEVGDFAFDPGVGVFALDVGADGGDQVADIPDAALGGAESKAELVGEGRHSGQCNAGARFQSFKVQSLRSAHQSANGKRDSSNFGHWRGLNQAAGYVVLLRSKEDVCHRRRLRY